MTTSQSEHTVSYRRVAMVFNLLVSDGLVQSFSVERRQADAIIHVTWIDDLEQPTRRQEFERDLAFWERIGIEDNDEPRTHLFRGKQNNQQILISWDEEYCSWVVDVSLFDTMTGKADHWAVHLFDVANVLGVPHPKCDWSDQWDVSAWLADLHEKGLLTEDTFDGATELSDTHR